MSTGFTLDGFPSMGAWVNYALGSENEHLPAFVAIPDPRGVPQAGPNHWALGVPAGRLSGDGVQRRAKPIRHPRRARRRLGRRATPRRATSCKLLNERHLAQFPGDTRTRRADRQLRTGREAAAVAPPTSANFDAESAHTLDSYGADDAERVKAGFARNCILARRLVERGRALRAALQRLVRDGRRGRQLGRAQADRPSSTPSTARFSTSRPPRCSPT